MVFLFCMFWEQLVLFICTGNFYRSRYAEALFNHHAQERGLEWRAFSRGFYPEKAGGNLAPEVKEWLQERGIEASLTAETPQELMEADLIEAAWVILLKRAEHLPMLQTSFPHWTDRVDSWEIHDVDVEPPEIAGPKIERKVLNLVGKLEDGHALGAQSPLALEF
jgi:protein-tyrosine phosphatase